MLAGVTIAALCLSVAPIEALAAGTSVDPATYVHSVCTSLSTYKSKLNTLQGSSGLANATTLTDARDRLASLLGQVVTATSTVVTDLQNAGAPNIKNGNKIAALIVREVAALRDAFAKAEHAAQALSTTSATAFKKGADAIGNHVTVVGKKVQNVLDGVRKRYNTTVLKAAQKQDPSCQGQR